jgi:hypothetical protein
MKLPIPVMALLILIAAVTLYILVRVFVFILPYLLGVIGLIIVAFVLGYLIKNRKP